MPTGTVLAIPVKTNPRFLGGSAGDGEHPYGTTYGDLERRWKPPPLATNECNIETTMQK